MLESLKFRNKRIFAIFIGLFIANLWFFKIYLSYMNINVSTIQSFENLSLIFSSIIIFAFISSKLPMLRKLGDSSLYDVTYFLIMAVLTLFIAYYNAVINQYVNLGSFLDTFNVLAISLILMIIAVHLKPFKEIIRGNKTRKNLIYCMVIFSFLAMLASSFSTSSNSLVNLRTMTILIASMFGGPIVGIPAAIVSVCFRFMFGGVTLVPCSISTLFASVVGSVIYLLNNKRFLNSPKSVILMFLIMGFEMLLIMLMVPGRMGFNIVQSIYAPMLFSSIVGIVLFKLVIKEYEEQAKPPKKDNESEIKELKELLIKQEEKINQLEEKINDK